MMNKNNTTGEMLIDRAISDECQITEGNIKIKPVPKDSGPLNNANEIDAKYTVVGGGEKSGRLIVTLISRFLVLYIQLFFQTKKNGFV
jgi:hypothetical protein